MKKMALALWLQYTAIFAVNVGFDLVVNITIRLVAMRLNCVPLLEELLL